MAQRSPGQRGDAPGERHAASKIRPKSTLNPITNHPNQFASTSTVQIYKGAEGFRLEKSSRSSCSLTKEEFGDGAATLSMGSATSPASIHELRSSSHADPLPLCGGAKPSSSSALHAPTTPPSPRMSAPSAPASPPTASRLRRSVKMSKRIQAETQPSSSGAADPVVGLNSQQSTGWSWKVNPSRSYAEVVRNGSARRPGAGVRSAMQGPSPAPQRRRKVFFHNNPRVVFFRKDSAPASIRILCSQQPHCEPRSCLKQPKVPVLESFVRAALPSPTEATLRFIRHPVPPTNKVQTDLAQAPWQPVRERYWWLRKKIGNVYPSPTTRHHNSAKFKEKVGDRCFNCLARSHKVAQCRDPPKCWRCRGSGHISSSCTNKIPSKTRCSPKAVDPHGDRRPRTYGNIQRWSCWSDDEAKVINIAPKLNCDSNGYIGEASRRRQLGHSCCSPPLSRFNESREERIASHPQWKPKEKSTSKRYYAAETNEVPSSHNYADGLEKFQYDTGVWPKAKSDAIVIVPQEHSPTTQQLEAWFGSLSAAKRTTQPPSDGIKITCQYMSPLDERKATTRCSDAIHIIPSLSFSDESWKNNTKAKLGEKHVESSSPLSKLRIDQPMVKTPTAQEIETEDTLTVQKQPPKPELVTESNLASMLKKFKEAVTKPLEPCLLETPNSKSVDKEGKKEEQKCSSQLKIKLKKQKMTNKMAQEILATPLSILGSEMALDELTLQQYLDTYKKTLSSSTLKACKNLIAVAERKRKHKKKLSCVGAKTVKKKKCSEVD